MGVGRDRLTRHFSRVLSDIITSEISSGVMCPELTRLGFKIDKVWFMDTR